jgi:lycopene beta-cyclase
LSDAGVEVFLNASVESVGANVVTLGDGRRFEGRFVFDGRGPEAPSAASRCGYQKFLGLEVELAEPVRDRTPVIMDAAVQQQDGFRFVYSLPFTDERVLIEDTYYSDDPELVKASLRSRVETYAAHKGWRIARIVREECGVLPLPWTSDRQPRFELPLRVGYRGGWLHPTTGYSIPLALRFALTVARCEPTELATAIKALARTVRRQSAFCMLLNRLLFCGYPPERRWNVLARFYRTMSDAAVRRFYALQMTRADCWRLLVGRPPKGLSLSRLLVGRES